MKLALIAGANPRVCKEGPKVRLFAGNWKFCVENHKDSAMVLHTELGQLPIHHDKEFTSSGECVQVKINGGTENYISVFAEHIS